MFPQQRLQPPQDFIDFAKSAPAAAKPPTMPTTLSLALRYLAAFRGRPLNLKDEQEMLDVERMHKAIRIANNFGSTPTHD